MRAVQFLGLSGSLRANSVHDAILRTISEELLPMDSRLIVHGLHDIPLYNEDLDGEGGKEPEAVRLIRQAVLEADGVVIGSPEYNHGMSGVMKNALDWLSRPHGKSALKGKPVLTFTASPAFTGGVRAQQQLNEALWAIPVELVRYPQIVIGGVGSKIVQGRLVDDAVRQFMERGLLELRSMISRV